MSIPGALQELLNEFSLLEDRDLRAELLIEWAESFSEVPAEVATRPFSKEQLVPGCESEAYIWSQASSQGALKFYFAVENPQGISAMALAAILDDTLSGAALEEILEIDNEIVYTFFGRELSMGKGQGLMGMVSMVKTLAKRVMESGRAS